MQRPSRADFFVTWILRCGGVAGGGALKAQWPAPAGPWARRLRSEVTLPWLEPEVPPSQSEQGRVRGLTRGCVVCADGQSLA